MKQTLLISSNVLVSRSEKNKYHIISLICGIKKNETNELIYRTEIDS